MKKALLMFVAALFMAPMIGCTPKNKDARPTVCIWNYDQMVKVKAALKENPGNPEYKAPYDSLIARANEIMSWKPISVVDKDDDCTAASGDKRDFITVGKYSWPDPANPGGPWIRKDCVLNPNFKRYDATRQANMNIALENLGLAYFFTGDEKYAEKSVDFIRAWFVNPETRMNPHLLYAATHPGHNNGFGMFIGIIEGRAFVNSFAYISLVENSDAFTPEVKAATQQWAREMSGWLTTSEFGIKESQATNNHGVAYDQQLLAFALFSGDEAMVKKITDEFPTKSIATHIEPDGTQPRELRRGFGYHYSMYNMAHFVEICEMVRPIAPDLYNYTTEDGRSIRAAIDFLASFFGKPVEAFAPYQQTEGWEEAHENLARVAFEARSFDKERYQAYTEMFEKYGPKNTIAPLLY